MPKNLMLKIMAFTLLALSYQSCGKKMANESRVRVHLPAEVTQQKLSSLAEDTNNERRAKRSQRVRTLSDIWAPSFEPESTSDLNCFGVLVGGSESELSSNLCEAFDEGGGDVVFGASALGAILGQTLSVSVPSGSARTLRILAWRAETEAACFSLNSAEVDARKLSHPYVVATQTLDLQPGENTVNIAASLTGARQLLNCDLFKANPGSLSSRLFSLSGTVSNTGVPLGTSDALVLQSNGDLVEISKTGNFNFSAPLIDKAPYAVTVFRQPAGKLCSVANGSGTADGRSVGNVEVSCVDRQFSVSGVVSGLAEGEAVSVVLNSGTPVALSGNGPFTFSQLLVHQSTYLVGVTSSPEGKICAVSNASGNINDANIANVIVNCLNEEPPIVPGPSPSPTPLVLIIPPPPDVFTVSGSVTGLIEGRAITLGLLTGEVTAASASSAGEAGADRSSFSSMVVLESNGGFVFPNAFPTGTNYLVIAFADGQICPVTNSTGEISGVNVTNIQVNCTPINFAVQVTVNGLSGFLAETSLQVALNEVQFLTFSAGSESSLQFFEQAIASGQPYSVQITAQPEGQNCVIDGPSGGVVFNFNPSVTVNCSSTLFTIGGIITGLEGENVVDLLLIVDGDEEGGTVHGVSGTGSFLLNTTVSSGQSYSVSVDSSPPGQICFVANGEGVVNAENITSLEVTCESSGFALGGTVSGISATPITVRLVLNGNFKGGTTHTLFEEGGFTLQTDLGPDTTYEVSFESIPQDLECSGSGLTGTITDSDVNTIAIGCAPSIRN